MPELTFEQFMNQVDQYLIKALGMTHDCLPDFMYYDAYDNEYPPRDTASDVIWDTLSDMYMDMESIQAIQSKLDA